MRVTSRRIVGYGLNVVVIAAFAVFLGFALFKLADIERDMRIDASENMLWVVTQAQREALRFETAVAHRAAGTGVNDDVKLRFDMLLSRLTLLSDAPQRRMLAKLGFGDDFPPVAGSVTALEPLLEAFEPGDVSLARLITETVAPLNMMLGRAANAAMVAEWDGLGGRLDESRSALWQVIGSALGIMLSGALLSSRLLMTLRNARRTEQSLRREKQFSELLIGSSGEGIFAVDRDGRCTVWNRAMERLIPISSGQAIGARLADISELFRAETVRDAIASSLDGEPTRFVEQEFRAEGRDGDPRHLDLLCSPLHNGEEIVGAISFVRDVTERHAAQRALKRHRDDLEELVEARTADLQAAQSQLISAMQDLERALERERGVSEFYRGFASTVSHEFRTPLAIIDSSMQRLVRRGDKVTRDEIAQRAARIRTAITRLTRLVEATLDAARLDTGQIEVRKRTCDLSELALAACGRQKELTPDRDVVLTDKPLGGAHALCDPNLVEHILSNLLSNAVKYSPSGDPVVLSVRLAEDGVLCSVADRGVGIPDDEVPRLFERFFRARTATGVAGTGIGLSLSRELARLQGGDIAVATREGEGTTVTLRLPRAHREIVPRLKTEDRSEVATA